MIYKVAGEIADLFERVDEDYPADKMEYEISKILMKYGIEDPTEEEGAYNHGRY